MDKENKNILLMDLEDIIQEVHKCGYFGKSWKMDENVSQLIEKFNAHLEDV